MKFPEKGLARFLVFKSPALAYMALIFYMSSGPVNSPTLNAIPDYYLHSSGYSLLSVLLFWAWNEGLASKKEPGSYLFPVLITVLYGISDEFHQSFVPGRDSAAIDVMFDAIGAMLGVAIVRLLYRLISSFRRTRAA
jgi:VanZ family protein